MNESDRSEVMQIVEDWGYCGWDDTRIAELEAQVERAHKLIEHLWRLVHESVEPRVP